ncbi:hypothetical protein IGI04_032800, partial [Brassica rapa subsp. trilocularis]
MKGLEKADLQKKEARESSQHRAYKSQSVSWQERSSHRRSYQARERTRQDYGRPSRPMREQVNHRYPLDPQAEAIIGKCQKESLRQGSQIPRIPVSQRLSGFGLIQTGGKDRVISASSTHERMPAILRLGSPPNPLMAMQNDLGSTHNLSNEERLPAILRLGPLPPPAGAETEAPNDVRRKPGRPPGKKKTTENQTRGVEEAPKNRRVTQQKPSPVRRK